MSFPGRVLSPDGSGLSKAGDDWVINEELTDRAACHQGSHAEELILLPVVSALERKIRFRCDFPPLPRRRLSNEAATALLTSQFWLCCSGPGGTLTTAVSLPACSTHQVISAFLSGFR